MNQNCTLTEFVEQKIQWPLTITGLGSISSCSDQKQNYLYFKDANDLLVVHRFHSGTNGVVTSNILTFEVNTNIQNNGHHLENLWCYGILYYENKLVGICSDKTNYIDAASRFVDHIISYDLSSMVLDIQKLSARYVIPKWAIQTGNCGVHMANATIWNGCVVIVKQLTLYKIDLTTLECDRGQYDIAGEYHHLFPSRNTTGNHIIATTYGVLIYFFNNSVFTLDMNKPSHNRKWQHDDEFGKLMRRLGMSIPLNCIVFSDASGHIGLFDINKMQIRYIQIQIHPVESIDDKYDVYRGMNSSTISSTNNLLSFDKMLNPIDDMHVYYDGYNMYVINGEQIFVSHKVKFTSKRLRLENVKGEEYIVHPFNNKMYHKHKTTRGGQWFLANDNITFIRPSNMSHCNSNHFAYKIMSKIGSGATSIVFEAELYHNINNNNYTYNVGIRKHDQNVVIKQTNKNIQTKEKKILDILNQKWNTSRNKISAKLLNYFEKDDIKYFVFEKLGISLQHLLMQRANNKFDLKTVLTIFDQMIVILYKLHSIGFVHNDIKPENIVIGNSKMTLEKLHLIDFGISTPFWDFQNDKHIEKTQTHFQGTFRFSSMNHHYLNLSQTRRDDIESLLYLCIYCLTGNLPWIMDYDQYKNKKKQSLPSKQEMFEQIRNIKGNTSIDEICTAIPNEFNIALTYIRKLKFDEMPNYQYLQQLFDELYVKSQNFFCPTLAMSDVYNGDNFIGSKIKLSTTSNKINKSQTSQSILQVKKSTRNHHDGNTNINKIKSIAQINSKIFSQYNQTVDKQDSTVTNCNTHITVQKQQICLRNRFGYVIDRLTIANGVPKHLKEIKQNCNNFGGIIIYEKVPNSKSNLNSFQVCGKIFMLDIETCMKMNQEYGLKYKNSKLVGQIHGAIYYYYFDKNINLIKENKKVNYNHKLSLIRGFSFDSKKMKFVFRSGAFNVVNYKFFDSKYKELANCEQKFVEQAINNYWIDNSNTSLTYANYQKNCYVTSIENLNRGQDRCIDDIDEKHIDSSHNQFNVDYSSCKLQEEYVDTMISKRSYASFHTIELNSDIVERIIGCLNCSDLLTVYKLSKQSRITMNKYSITHCKQAYICTISMTKRDDYINACITLMEEFPDKPSQYQDKINFLTMTINTDRDKTNIKNENSHDINNDNRSSLVTFFVCLLNKTDIVMSHNYNALMTSRIGMALTDLESKYTVRMNSMTYIIDKTISEKHGVKIDYIKHRSGKNKCAHDRDNHDVFEWNWYCGKSRSITTDGHWNINGWKKYHEKINDQIETAFKNQSLESVVIEIFHQRSKTMQHCMILFEKESQKQSQSVKDYNEFQDATNDRWNDAFTQYFYQINIQTKKMRIVKRVNISKRKSFDKAIVDILDDYFD